jgi:hypothetical protein
MNGQPNAEPAALASPSGGDFPEAASRRFAQGAFTSGLSVPDFAACLQMGLEPVGFVQGYCVMQWQWYGMNSPYGVMSTGPGQRSQAYSETYSCPHGFVSNEHRMWGENYEQTWLEDAWSKGFATAYNRMVEEAGGGGAHGIVGVVDSTERLSDGGLLEFRMQGTAVKIPGAPDPGDAEPWTTYLAGQRFAKLIEAGYMPVSVAATVTSVRVWANCVTEYLTEGGGMLSTAQSTGQEIIQLASAQMAVRRLARERVRNQLGHDALHGAVMSTEEYEIGKGDAELQCTLRGNRVRRFQDFDPLPAPRPTVRLL